KKPERRTPLYRLVPLGRRPPRSRSPRSRSDWPLQRRQIQPVERPGGAADRQGVAYAGEDTDDERVRADRLLPLGSPRLRPCPRLPRRAARVHAPRDRRPRAAPPRRRGVAARQPPRALGLRPGHPGAGRRPRTPGPGRPDGERLAITRRATP